MKTVIITGASSGIGAATAILLNQNGYQVVLAARRTEKLEKIAKQLNENHLVVKTDVTVIEDVERLIHLSVEKFGKVDVLINNAGLGYIAPLQEGKLEDWHSMFNVNVNGLLTCIHKALPHLLSSKGTIINIASVAAHEVFPNTVVYCATKHAVNAITVGIRKEFRDKVKVCNISPGAVQTEFLEQSEDNDNVKQMREYFFNNETLKGEDIAGVIFEVLSKPEHVAINEVIIRPNL
ncbi:MAG: NADP-dependent 3-hydroxy acid dehydrogenase YdfG [Chitinophagales bacterium]|jgi:NADP-dependent 3-hydroxy acid dehydrogenase YdfG